MTEKDEKKKAIYIALTKDFDKLNMDFYQNKILNGVLYFGFAETKQEVKDFIDSFRSTKNIYYVRLHAGYLNELADKHDFFIPRIYDCGGTMVSDDEIEFLYNNGNADFGSDILVNMLVEVKRLLTRYKHKSIKKYRRETDKIIKTLLGYCNEEVYDDIQESISEIEITKQLLKEYNMR